VAYLASAELGCHLVLGWPLPVRVLDLYVEFRNWTNGLSLPHGAGLLGALAWFGLDSIGAGEKSSMRALADRGGPWSAEEREALLAYCETDVSALARLLPRMLPDIDLPRALNWGRYMRAVAGMEHAGIPIDVSTLSQLRAGWDAILDRLVREIDYRFGVFRGRRFSVDRWAEWLVRNGVPWPRLVSGELALDDDTFREMARSHSDVALIRELRNSLAQLRLRELSVGADGRNRTMLSPFRAVTSRNQPSNSRFIFGPSGWLRGLIRPEPGRALAYVDWSQQEFGIGAALSEDAAMVEAYRSGDPYLTFGKQAGRIPADATKATHAAERELFKACVLGVQYGMGAESLGLRVGGPTARGRQLLRLHQETYSKFWAWSDGAEHHAMLQNQLHTVFGWVVRVGPNANPRSLRNFPCQGNGAEMLRWACCLMSERGVGLVAPIHDAVLVEGPAGTIAETVAEAQRAMAEASEAVLGGFPLRTHAAIVRWPDRSMDERGREFWGRVMALLPDVAEAERRHANVGRGRLVVRRVGRPVHFCGEG
jgi:hypothetical protein